MRNESRLQAYVAKITGKRTDYRRDSNLQRSHCMYWFYLGSGTTDTFGSFTNNVLMAQVVSWEF